MHFRQVGQRVDGPQCLAAQNHGLHHNQMSVLKNAAHCARPWGNHIIAGIVSRTLADIAGEQFAIG